MILFVILLAFVYAVVIGANDAANSFGNWVGARIGKVIIGMLLCGLFAIFGAVAEGHKVTKTIGSGIIPSSYLTAEMAAIGIIGAILWVAIVTYFGLPISATHSVVGGIAGLGLAMAAPVNWLVLKKIVICWLATPTASCLIAYLTFSFVLFIIKKLKIHKEFSKLSKYLITVSSCYVAYTWGANDVGNAVALISTAKVLPLKLSLFIGGVGICIGVVLFGSKVAITVGCNITRITPTMGVCSDIATAMVVHFFTQLKIPVSTTHALVGAIVGLGLVRGARIVNFKIIRDIVFAWVITPVVSGLISFCVYHIFRICKG